LSLEDAAVFGAAAHAHARLFARRVLAVPEVVGLTIVPDTGVARMRYVADAGQRPAALNRLADALQSGAAVLTDEELPDWPAEATMRWVRCGGRLTCLNIEETGPGRLRLGHAWLQGGNTSLSLRLGKVLKGLAGVRGIRTDPARNVMEVLYSPARVGAERIISSIETEFSRYDPSGLAMDLSQVPMVMSNTLVGLSTLGELLLPVATPAAAGILVLNNLGTARDAVVQLGRGKVGVPLFYTALLTCSIVTGQVLAFALTDWSLRYWQRRWRKQMSQETRTLIEERLPPTVQVRRIDESGREFPSDAHTLRPGQHLRVLEGETVPADGSLIHGLALVDESLVTGSRAPLRKSAGDNVLAGSRVLAGGLDMVAQRVGAQTQAGRMAQDILETVAAIPANSRLREKASGMADKTAVPTLATAGVGWLAGDLITVGAILHQDWISGPELAVPLLALHHVRAALGHGAVTLNPAAIPRLGECDFVVLDGDDPRLMRRMLALTAMNSRIADTETLLRLAADAGLYLGGDIALSLTEACRAQGLIIRQPELLALEPNAVLVAQGGHRIRLKAERMIENTRLEVDIDGQSVAELTLNESPVPAMADTVARLRSMGLHAFLMTSRADSETQELAQSLGIDLYGGELDQTAKRHFLEGLHLRGIKALLAGRLAGQVELARAAHVSMDVVEDQTQPSPADFILMNGDYAGLANLIATARSYPSDLHRSTRMATVPNLLCIAGAFGGLLNGITSGIIANVGVVNVDRQLRRHLEAGKPTRENRLVRLLA